MASFVATLNILLDSIMATRKKYAAVTNTPARKRLFHLVSLAVLTLSSSVYAASTNNITYYQALYHQYLGDYPTATTHLLISNERDELKEQQKLDAQLLLASLYLNFGMQNAATTLFNKLTQENIPPRIRDQAWLHIAQMSYSKNQFEQARSALDMIQSALVKQHENNRWLLDTQLLSQEQKWQEAIKTLEKLPRSSVHYPYAQYNLAISMLGEDDSDKARKMLNSLIQKPEKDKSSEVKDFSDYAALTLGYHHLDSGNYESARKAFNKVRVESPFLQQALLGLGWTYVGDQNFNMALTPWFELLETPSHSVARLESLIAIPQTLSQISAYQPAIAYFETASSHYINEISALEILLDEIQNSNLFASSFFSTEITTASGMATLDDLDPALQHPYLSDQLSSNEFQTGIKRIQELTLIRRNMEKRLEDLDSYEDILITRRQAFEKKLVNITNQAAKLTFINLNTHAADITKAIQLLESQHDTELLANSEERGYLTTLRQLQERLDLAAEHLDVSEQEEKRRFYEGLLTWRIHSEYFPRRWNLVKAQQQAIKLLNDINKRKVALERGERESKQQLEHYRLRIDRLRLELKLAVEKTGHLIDAQKTQLKSDLASHLLALRDKFYQYRDQARFGIAQIYDFWSQHQGATENEQE